MDHTQNLPLRFTLVTCGSFKSSLILSDSPMYSSSAYPTTIPSSDLVTRDLPAVDARIGTRRQNTTAGFPVGLIPQLIDVLHILTEGQDLLSRKIRTARLDESRDPVPIVEQIERFEIPAVRPIVDSGSATVETPPLLRRKTLSLTGRPRQRTVFGMDRPVRSGHEGRWCRYPTCERPRLSVTLRLTGGNAVPMRWAILQVPQLFSPCRWTPCRLPRQQPRRRCVATTTSSTSWMQSLASLPDPTELTRGPW